MKRSLSVALSAVVTVISLSCLTAVAADKTKAPKPPHGFTALFNGVDLAGWHGMPHFDPRNLKKMSPEELAKQKESWNADFKQHWRVEDNELVNDGKGPFATSDKEYKDIELYVEYKTVPLADSGVYLRATPQVQIWDYTEKAKFNLGADKGSGGLWNNSAGAPGKDPLVLADKPFGEWNKFHIIQVDDITTVYLNDKLVVDHAKMENYWDRSQPLFESGPIQLQTHGGEIRWRNIYVREIPEKERAKYLKSKSTSGGEQVQLFDGKTLNGWTQRGGQAKYSVEDGAIVGRSVANTPNSFLCTDKEYSDFILELEVKVDPKLNSGIQIRSQCFDKETEAKDAKGDVVKNDKGKPIKIEAGRVHGYQVEIDPSPRAWSGGIYDEARRGWLQDLKNNPAAQKAFKNNEWNKYRIEARGDSIKTWINGVPAADLHDSLTPKGFIALQVHGIGKDKEKENTEVRWRNIRFTDLSAK